MHDALIADAISVRASGRLLLDNVSLAARYGEVTAIIGPNGAGKSTLLRALLGIAPHAGNVQVDGRDLAKMTTRERARSIAYVPQQTQLMASVRVRDAVAQGRFAHGEGFSSATHKNAERVERALCDVQARELADRVFNKLSGGEQRRVLLARALATEARVLLLDEPTSGLDVAHVLRFHALMRALAQRGYAVLTVLHDLIDVHHHTDRAVLLAEGRVVEAGSARELVSSMSVQRVYGVRLRETQLPFELTVGR